MSKLVFYLTEFDRLENFSAKNLGRIFSSVKLENESP